VSQQIAGSTPLVTGANRGIGRALVDALVASGASRVYAAARTLASLDPIRAQHGDVIVPILLDIRNKDQIAQAARAAGDVNILINNAGIISPMGTTLDALDADVLRKEMDVNVYGTLAMTQAFAPTLERNGGGTLVNLVTIAALVNFPLFVTYSASKAALHSLTQATRVALSKQGTRVIGVYPGPIDTDMAAGIPFEKTPSSTAAQAILRAVEHGDEDVFTDPMSQQLGAMYLSDPKGLERTVAQMAA
jgi:NAD(P)-dependent dehydrogenase (short-subunit alcohol dehydrogenase family)